MCSLWIFLIYNLLSLLKHFLHRSKVLSIKYGKGRSLPYTDTWSSACSLRSRLLYGVWVVSCVLTCHCLTRWRDTSHFIIHGARPAGPGQGWSVIRLLLISISSVTPLITLLPQKLTLKLLLIGDVSLPNFCNYKRPDRILCFGIRLS